MKNAYQARMRMQKQLASVYVWWWAARTFLLAQIRRSMTKPTK